MPSKFCNRYAQRPGKYQMHAQRVGTLVQAWTQGRRCCIAAENFGKAARFSVVMNGTGQFMKENWFKRKSFFVKLYAYVVCIAR